MLQTKSVLEIVNVVASALVEQKIDLLEITKAYPEVEYHSEQFPGITYRMIDSKTVTLIFVSGKVVCVRVRKESEVYRAIHNIHTVLEEKNLMQYKN
jgi:transcription initiation factor TFIID TATA-box-binding protein